MTAAEKATIVLVGYSRTLLVGLAGHIPPGSVLVIEDPVVAASRKVQDATAADPLVDRLVLAEYQEIDRLRTLIDEEPSLREARAVLPGVEYAVPAAAHLAASLGLPGAGRRAASIFRDKSEQRRTAAAAGLRNPRFRVVGTPAEAWDFLVHVGGKCVIKPTARQASLGVRFVDLNDGPHGVADAMRLAAEPGESQLIPARGIASAVIIEEAVSGPEYSVEMLVSNGRSCFANVTAKQLAGGAFPVELGHLMPGAPPELGDQLVAATATLITAADFEFGVVHCEWIVADGAPVLVECAARIPGDEITTLLSLAYGRPFIHAYLQVLLADDPGFPGQPGHGAAIRFLTTTPGRLVRINGVAEARRAPGVEMLRLTAAPGDLVTKLTSSWDRLGYVVTRGGDAADAVRLADAAARRIRFDLDLDLDSDLPTATL